MRSWNDFRSLSPTSWIWPRAGCSRGVDRNIGSPPLDRWRFLRLRYRQHLVFHFRLALRPQRGWRRCATICAFHCRWHQAFCRNFRNCRRGNNRMLEQLRPWVRPTATIWTPPSIFRSSQTTPPWSSGTAAGAVTERTFRSKRAAGLPK